jgi:hypothetical protein
MAQGTINDFTSAAREQRPLGAERTPPTANVRSADFTATPDTTSHGVGAGRIQTPPGAAQPFSNDNAVDWDCAICSCGKFPFPIVPLSIEEQRLIERRSGF